MSQSEAGPALDWCERCRHTHRPDGDHLWPSECADCVGLFLGGMTALWLRGLVPSRVGTARTHKKRRYDTRRKLRALGYSEKRIDKLLARKASRQQARRDAARARSEAVG